MSEPLDSLRICDAVYATCCADERGVAAVLFWARNHVFGEPLVLLDWELRPLAPDLWGWTEATLERLVGENRARQGSLGVWVEGAVLAHQAQLLGIRATAMPEHVVADSNWNAASVSTAFYVRSGQVKIAAPAHARTREHKFGALTWAGGPRPDDQTVAAFLFGVVLGLDEASARPAPPARVKLVA